MDLNGDEKQYTEPIRFATNYYSILQIAETKIRLAKGIEFYKKIFGDHIHEHSNEEMKTENASILRAYYTGDYPNLAKSSTSSVTSQLSPEISRSTPEDSWLPEFSRSTPSLTSPSATVERDNPNYYTTNLPNYKALDLASNTSASSWNRYNLSRLINSKELKSLIDDPTLDDLKVCDGYDDPFQYEVFNKISLKSAASYIKYCQKLLTIRFQHFDFMNENKLWVPTLKDDFEHLVLRNYDQKTRKHGKFESYGVNCKTNLLFSDGLNYIPPQFDIYFGSTVARALFSKQKLPSFNYHCSVELNGTFYILGGVMPIYNYEFECPDLTKYTVDGISNLPPPLISELINHPAMVSNPDLYTIYANSYKLRKPEISGHIPPPLIAMQGTALNDRYILYYGGFEVKTKLLSSNIDDSIQIQKRAFLNNSAYILDTVSFRFTKVEIVTEPNSLDEFPTFHNRFGHLQIISDFDVRNSQKQKTQAKSSKRSLSDEPDIVQLQGITDLPGQKKKKDNEQRNDETKKSLMTSIIYIYGGYTQIRDDMFEALEDFWCIDLKILARGKRGYLKFAETAVASIIAKPEGSKNWPGPLAFCAFCIPEEVIVRKAALKTALLENLDRNFHLTKETLHIGSEKNDMMKASMLPKKSSVNNLKDLHTLNSDMHSHSGSDYLKARHNQKDNDFTTQSILSHMNLNPSKPSMRENSAEKGHTLIVHGGTDGHMVYGNMWWLDLETGQWTSVDIYSEEEDTGELFNTKICLAGHYMAKIGHNIILIGGMTDIDKQKIYDKKYNNSDILQDEGNYMFTTVDLVDLRIKGRWHMRDKLIEGDVSDRLLLSVGCGVLQSEGTIAIIGGCIIERPALDNVSLRGAMLECVLPSMGLTE